MSFYHDPPHRAAGLVLLSILGAISTLVFLLFRGDLTPTTELIVESGRSGLVLDRGAKVTFNGVPVGRVSDIDVVQRDGAPVARLTAKIESRYMRVIPANVRADVQASTIFGNKYLGFSSPSDPSPQRVAGGAVIAGSSVTTEFQTLFETVTGLAEKIDPVKLNITLSTAAEALTGLGAKLGRSLADANSVLAEVNPRLPAVQRGARSVAAAADVYTAAGPDLWDGLDNSLTPAATLTAQQRDLDAALLASMGFSDAATDTVGRGAPHLIRLVADLVPSSRLLDTYSPALFCTIRNTAELVPLALSAFGGNGYSLAAHSILPVGAPNPYVYPDNLPRTNARGGPGGAPGCWQPVDRNFWPAPTLVADTGASLAPYNHFELGQPLLNEYVWGRQVGENTINP